MRYIIPCVLLALTTCLYADEPKSKAIRKYENEVEVLRKQGQAAIKRLEGVFEKEVEKLRGKTLTALQEELDSALEAKDLDKAVALREAIAGFEDEDEAGLSSKIEVVNKKKVKKQIPRIALRFNGHRYAINSSPMTWHVARDYCESVGGHLARVNSKEEFAFLIRSFLTKVSSGAHIDGSDEVQKGVWIYSDGERVDFSVMKYSLRNESKYQYLSLSKDSEGIVLNGDNEGGLFIIEWDN